AARARRSGRWPLADLPFAAVGVPAAALALQAVAAARRASRAGASSGSTPGHAAAPLTDRSRGAAIVRAAPRRARHRRAHLPHVALAVDTAARDARRIAA